MYLRWLAAGSAMVCISFIVFYSPTDPWSSAIAGTIGGGAFAAVYLIRQLAASKVSLLKKILLIVLLAVLFAATASAWSVFYSMTTWQRAKLTEIRTRISDEAIVGQTQEALMPVYRAYYEQKEPKQSLGILFRRIHSSDIHENKLTVKVHSDDLYFITGVSDSAVTIVSMDSVARGWSPVFSNINGQKGHIQMCSVLTEKGVSHERKN
ncbi:MAG: hypothetical protein NTV54_09745 [Ignavibacteriales bacterium]|nr:hypothetical protein [Ignavibacteriales bacterium]